jgi:hypothetical protein
MQADTFDAFEASLKREKREKKEKKKDKKKEKKQKTKKAKVDQQAPVVAGEDMSDLFRADAESMTDRKERRKQERHETELQNNTERASVLMSRMVNPEALLVSGADDEDKNPKQMKRVLSGLALARQMAQQQQQEKQQQQDRPVQDVRAPSTPVLDGAAAMPQWKKSEGSVFASPTSRPKQAAVSNLKPEREEQQREEQQEQKNEGGARGVAAALRARLLAGKSATDSNNKREDAKKVVVQNVNSRGETVLVPKAAAKSGTDSM